MSGNVKQPSLSQKFLSDVATEKVRQIIEVKRPICSAQNFYPSNDSFFTRQNFLLAKTFLILSNLTLFPVDLYI
jgi:hypothetical protein